MDSKTLITRNKRFVIEIVHLLDELPKTMVFDVFGKQLIRCSSSVGANYRATCRAKSEADFIYKLKIVEEEADESIYFLELIKEVYRGRNESKIDELIKEANELVAIYVASIKTMRNKINNRKSKVVNQKSKVVNQQS